MTRAAPATGFRHRLGGMIALAVVAVACAGAPAVRAPGGATAPATAVAAITADGAQTLALVRRESFLLAPVTIDGRPAGEFLVDTGAGATFVDRGLADELRLPAVVDAKVQGAHFIGRAEIRELHHLAAGGIALVAAPTVALDLVEVRAQLGSTVTGVVGFPTLGSAPFTLDFVAATLTVHDPARFIPPAGVASELLRIHQVPYVEATLADGLDVWLLLDTGSLFGLTLWRALVDDHADVLTVPQKRWVHTSGIGGGTQVMQSEVRALHVFGRDHANVPVLIQDAPPEGWRHPKVAGRIGLALLQGSRITIHPTQRRIWIQP